MRSDNVMQYSDKVICFQINIPKLTIQICAAFFTVDTWKGTLIEKMLLLKICLKCFFGTPIRNQLKSNKKIKRNLFVVNSCLALTPLFLVGPHNTFIRFRSVWPIALKKSVTLKEDSQPGFSK